MKTFSWKNPKYTTKTMNIKETRLLQAAARGRTNEVRALLHDGAGTNIEAKDGYGRTVLHCAARSGHAETVRALLKAGANTEAKNPSGCTALHRAAWNGPAEIVQVLLEAGADTEAKDDDGWTALHCAVWNGPAEIVQVLLEAGADTEARTSNGQTARDLAAECNHLDVTGLLDAWARQRVLMDLVPGSQDAEDTPACL